MFRFEGERTWHRMPPRSERPATYPGALCGRHEGERAASAQLRRSIEPAELCGDCELGRRVVWPPQVARGPRIGPAVDEVPNDALREAFLASGLSYSELAGRLGIDSARPARSLGLRPLSAGRYQRWMQRENAARYARALGLDPHEVGL